MALPLVNGQAYGWSKVQIMILGVMVVGIDAIKYDDETEIEDGYGGGDRVVRRGYGNVKTSGSVTLHMEEIAALQRVVPSRRLQDIAEFDIVVAWKTDDGKVLSDTLKACRFLKTPRGASQNDKFISHEVPLIIGDIVTK